ncbi:DUF6252 family protein [Aureispira anguillae]|uniref:Uncharacterized protein n=1 Tax=Aureispira anguillae TaxID=2864201 RepID=A0A915YME7_9BACT|nr:hypothetical protein [Aureispira anguillae]BDS15483.1 hypothetical protein AsAng_0062670 [Aureispira anguillae]
MLPKKIHFQHKKITKIYETNTDGASGQHKTCVTNQSITYCDGALATYTTNGKNLVSEKMLNEPFGTITISQNNTTDKTISGTFDFKVKDFFQPTAQPVHMTGSFSDLPYTVLN